MRFLVWLLIALPLAAFEYNPLLLRAQSTIFPKLLLLCETPKTLLVGNTMVLTIVHTQEDILTATALKLMINEQYHDHLGAYPFKIKLRRFDRLDGIHKSSAYYLLKLPAPAPVINLALRQHSITFAYDVADLEAGALFSLALQRHTIIYLNHGILDRYRIRFNETLYQVVRFTDDTAP